MTPFVSLVDEDIEELKKQIKVHEAHIKVLSLILERARNKHEELLLRYKSTDCTPESEILDITSNADADAYIDKVMSFTLHTKHEKLLVIDNMLQMVDNTESHIRWCNNKIDESHEQIKHYLVCVYCKTGSGETCSYCK